ncbi:universal stress protein [Variovorax sp. GT1P44]|uniref:universal stress protein n=1 Tax=Variovorax sp. GT1P44 TaxID=3443742 RepID=UPI003F44912C
MYQRILVPVDGSLTSMRGLEEAIRIAQLTHGRLRLIHVVDELSFSFGMEAYAGYGGDLLGILRENGARVLEQAKSIVAATGIEVDTILNDTFSGLVHVLVTAEASQWPADLIVLGTHGRRGVGRMVLGSSAENILRYATVPVLLVRAPEVVATTAAHPAAAHMSLPAGALAME